MVAWKDDPDRALLKQDVLDGSIPASMKPKDARATRTEYAAMPAKTFASRLTGMRKMIAKTGGEEEKPKEEKWNKHNLVRQQLRKDLAKGFIQLNADPKLAWQSRAIYNVMDFDLWKSRYKGMQKMVKESLERAADDAHDLYHDRMLHPQQQFNSLGLPEWNQHEAKELLEIDMDDDKHKQMTPEAIYLSRLQYQDFTLDIFRGHIYQEEQTRKWRKQWVDGKKEYAIVPQPTNH